MSDTPCAVSNVGPPKSVTTYDRRRDDYDRGSEVLPIVSNAGSRTGHLCTTGVSCVWHDMSAPSRPRVNWLALCRIRDERTCSRRGAAPFSESSPPVFTGSKSQTTGRNRRRPSRNLSPGQLSKIRRRASRPFRMPIRNMSMTTGTTI